MPRHYQAQETLRFILTSSLRDAKNNNNSFDQIKLKYLRSEITLYTLDMQKKSTINNAIRYIRRQINSLWAIDTAAESISTVVLDGLSWYEHPWVLVPANVTG